MLEKLFGNVTIERVLFFLLTNERCYGSQLAQRFDSPLYSFQNALERLERAGIIVSFKVGKTRTYEFNPRYPFLIELKALIKKAYLSLPSKIKETYYEPTLRKRPRRTGKPL